MPIIDMGWGNRDWVADLVYIPLAYSKGSECREEVGATMAGFGHNDIDHPMCIGEETAFLNAPERECHEGFQ